VTKTVTQSRYLTYSTL